MKKYVHKAMLKKLDGQTNIDKYGIAAHELTQYFQYIFRNLSKFFLQMLRT